MEQGRYFGGFYGGVLTLLAISITFGE